MIPATITTASAAIEPADVAACRIESARDVPGDWSVQHSRRVALAKPREFRQREFARGANIVTPAIPIGFVCQPGEVRDLRRWGFGAIPFSLAHNERGQMLRLIAEIDVHLFVIVDDVGAIKGFDLGGLLRIYGRIRRITRQAFSKARNRRQLVDLVVMGGTQR